MTKGRVTYTSVKLSNELLSNNSILMFNIGLTKNWNFFMPNQTFL